MTRLPASPRPPASLFLLIGLLVLALPFPLAAQQVPDLTSRLQLLGNPVTEFYKKPSDKSGARDLQIFGDRLYIGHGTTNSSQNTRVLYYDLDRKVFDYERDEDDKEITVRSELIRNMRVQDGELLLEDYDPHGRVRFYRKDARGNWTIRDVAPDAHARDLFKHGNEYFINHGHTNTVFPYVYHSTDNGQSWTALKQTNLYGGFGTAYEEFFEFGGKLYLTGINSGYNPDTKRSGATGQPFMLRYEGNGTFDIAYARREDFIPNGNLGYEFVRLAQPLGRKLLFAWGDKRVFLASSVEPLRHTQVNLPAYSVSDITIHNGYAYVLMWTKSGSQYRNLVYRVAEDGSVQGVLSVDSGDIFSSLELHDNTVYLAAPGVRLYKVDVQLASTGPSAPPPPTAPQPTNLTLDLKVLLQGPYDADRGAMRASIKNHLAIEQAFEGLPAKLYGDADFWEVAPSAMDGDLVDFVMLELRSSTAPSSRVARRAALLMADGRVRGFDGTSLPRFNNVPAGKYYVVVRHRNHLDVMSAESIDFSSGSARYDFTTSADRAYGSGALARIKSGVYALFTGDMDASGVIDATDVFSAWSRQNGYAGYRNADLDLSGFVNAFDLIKLWMPNSGRRTQVPD